MNINNTMTWATNSFRYLKQKKFLIFSVHVLQQKFQTNNGQTFWINVPIVDEVKARS